jgi:hypothetical protein
MGTNPELELNVHARQILLNARDLVGRGWSCGAAARDAEGRAVDPLHPSARSWSIAGALEAAAAREAYGRKGDMDARAPAVAAAALSTAIESEAENEGLQSLTRAIRELAPAERRRPQASSIGSDGGRAVRDTRGARRANEAVRCGVCTRELGQEGLRLISAGEMVGAFCSPPCLAAAEALAGLQRWAAELDAHGRRDEAEAREALGDDLLLLWRRGGGPNPKVVAEAVALARGRDGLP